MNAIDKNFLIGFQEDTDKKVVSELFTKHKIFKEIHISVNLTRPSMLLARSKEKNVRVEVNSVQDNRLILKKGGKGGRCSTVIMNILLDEISNCLIKKYSANIYDFEFEVRDFRYSLEIEI